MGMNQSEQIRIEAHAILSDLEIQRAPSQASILRYLADRAQDNTLTVSQYEIATMALGRRDDFDETTDSVVRVQIGRLRKRMAEHYRRISPDNDMYLYIRPGEYRLRLGPAKIAYPDLFAVPGKAASPPDNGDRTAATLSDLPQSASKISGNWAWMGAVFAIVLSTVVFAILLQPNDEAAGAPLAELSEKPLVASELRVADDLARILPGTDFRDAITIEIDRMLQMSLISRTQVGETDQRADFTVYVLLTKGTAKDSVTIFASMRDAAGNLVKSSTFADVPVAGAPAIISQMIASFISPSGRLSGYLARRIEGPPANDFECYLALENLRSQGTNVLALLNHCMTKFGDSEYQSIFEVRQIAVEIQDHRAQGERLSRQMAPWAKLDDLLAQNPDNNYANTLAAKLLIGSGQCAEAKKFAERAFVHGRTFPALEMAVLVDSYGCPLDSAARAKLDRRVAAIIAVDQDTNSPVLRTFLLLGAILSDQTAAQATLAGLPSVLEDKVDVEEFNSAVGRQLEGKASSQDLVLINAVLSRLVWNDSARSRILQKLRMI